MKCTKHYINISQSGVHEGSVGGLWVKRKANHYRITFQIKLNPFKIITIKIKCILTNVNVVFVYLHSTCDH